MLVNVEFILTVRSPLHEHLSYDEQYDGLGPCRKTVTNVEHFLVILQITSGGYRTKHGQAIRTDLITEFTHIKHVQAEKTNSSMNSVWIV